MIAPFDWWLLIVGLAAGAALAWLVLADLRRRDEDLEERERDEEAGWISATLGGEGRPVPQGDVRNVLALHAWYLREPPHLESPGYADPDSLMPDDLGARERPEEEAEGSGPGAG